MPKTNKKIMIYDNKTHEWEVNEVKFPLARDYQNARVTRLEQNYAVMVGAKKTVTVKIKDLLKGKYEKTNQ